MEIHSIILILIWIKDLLNYIDYEINNDYMMILKIEK